MKLPLSRKAVAVLLMIVASPLATVRAALPSEVAAVLEANIAASGGRDLIASIKSSRLKGTMSIPAIGMNGTTEMAMKSPDKLYVAQTIPGMGTIVQAYDGEIGWANDPMQGFRHLSEGEIVSLKHNDNFSDMLAYNEVYSSGEKMADSVVDGQAVNVLKLTAAETGLEQTCYYSKDSGLLLRMDMLVDMGPMGQLPASMIVKSYQEKDGISFPGSLEVTNAGMIINISFNSLELNVELEDSLFSPPQ
ncbi:hypothetical protein IEN85_18385 [Pelagicoccus sp. NFK12]|uniref:Outer membrane lipoprotein-sorting protein n=1 Tax=Pelagicoccus enzymogenes TaxID=2773457 RepID=A0A927FD37_9BACT|nr:hypothetical protein [Pelagicoccus enzymogenes]MBD5781475.1 hypothetical protein [Pelagicoccus enzymogenes]